MPDDLHIWIATTQTIDCKGSVPDSLRRSSPAYLHSKKEEIEIEAEPGEDIFVRDGHQDGGTAVTQDWEDGIVGRGDDRCRASRPRGAHGWFIAFARTPHVSQFVIICFLAVCHDA